MGEMDELILATVYPFHMQKSMKAWYWKGFCAMQFGFGRFLLLTVCIHLS